jgi:hypothetical protein
MAVKKLPRMTYRYIQELTPEEIGKMDTDEVKKLLTATRKKVNTRRDQLHKVEDKVFSGALHKLEFGKDILDNPKSVDEMSRNRMLSEFFWLQKFLQSKTSNVKGARKANIEEDARIFGVTKKGRPKYRMNAQQRTDFWKVYLEFVHQHPTATNLFQSEQIMQHLGEMRKGSKGKNIDLSPETLNYVYNSLYEKMMEEHGEYEYSDANVFSGNWDDKQR